MRISGTFNGTGADVYLCIGFVPDWVHLWNVEATTPLEVVWNVDMQRSAEFCDGFEFQWHGTFGSSDATPLTTGNGIKTYYGGKTLASGDVGTTTYGEGVYLKPDNRDYRYTSTDSPFGVGDATTTTVTTWTLYSGYGGHFDYPVTKTYIDEGSRICIDGRWYSINAISSNGELTNEVTLSNTGVASGNIQFISGMYSLRPMIAGEVSKDGFLISNTTLNVNNDIVIFEAGKYDW